MNIQSLNNNLKGERAQKKDIGHMNEESATNSTHNDEAFLKETRSMLDLKALEEIEKNPKISQRELSNRLGVALGITNPLLKTLAHKGLIKIRGTNNRTLTYHLTHAGVLAKSRLAMRWTLNTIEFYRQARHRIADRLGYLAQQGVTSVALYGVGELTEIAVIVAPEVGLKVSHIIGEQIADSTRKVLDIPIVQLSELDSSAIDALVICVEVEDDRIKELEEHVQPAIEVYQLV